MRAGSIMTESCRKQVIVLVGPKGSGKSTIGHLLAAELGVHFLRVEPIFLAVRAEVGASPSGFEQRGFEAVLASLTDAIAHYDTVCFESTGASAHFSWLLSELACVARVLPVRVSAAADECIRRVQTRDTSIHIPVSDDQVDRINKLAVQVQLPWVAEIDNQGAFRGTMILESIRILLAHHEPQPAA